MAILLYVHCLRTTSVDCDSPIRTLEDKKTPVRGKEA
jgi:hypothetical protein